MIRIVIADGQEEFRNYLCKYLSNQNDFKIVGVGGDSYEAVKLVDLHKPDIVLMDTHLPLGDGIKTAALIKYRSPHTSVIINGDNSERRVFSVLFSGVSGYITRQENSNLLCHAIRAVYYGGSFTDPDIFLKLKTIVTGLAGNIVKSRGDLRTTQPGKIRKREKRNQGNDPTAKLPRTISPSEMKIMGYVGKGYTNKEIAEKLHLTEGTIRNYVSSVLQKTGFRDRTQIAIYAVRTGIAVSS
ncbi:MAG: response regulator transcription factor [Treponema sp.]|nr:response regulator transcription factor [Treponema sp.]